MFEKFDVLGLVVNDAVTVVSVVLFFLIETVEVSPEPKVPRVLFVR